MKNSDIKLVACLSLITAGDVLLYLGNRWQFFLGLVLVAFVGLFSSYQGTRRGNIISWFAVICVLAFLAWQHLSSGHRLSLISLAIVWLMFIFAEVREWRANRSLSDDA
jgi:hypothetical protein